MPFAESVTDDEYGNCLGSPDDTKTITYWRKIAGLKDSYPTDAPTYTVPGIILNVKHRVLPTDSVIVDALLGQGEALDCYNKNMQSAATHSANLDNLMKQEEVNKVKKGIEVVEAQTTPVEKADAFKKIFGTCCEPETP